MNKKMAQELALLKNESESSQVPAEKNLERTP
jgi:hypothetical protein